MYAVVEVTGGAIIVPDGGYEGWHALDVSELGTENAESHGGTMDEVRCSQHAVDIV